MCSKCVFAELDRENTLKFYFIDFLDAVIWSTQDPTLEEKNYHTFEAFHDQEGNRIFEKANYGLVFESFYLLDTESAPFITIVAGDALHQWNLIQHPLYCK